MQRRTFSRIILLLALCSLPAIAQEGNGWQFDSLGLNTTSPESDAQQVYDVLLKMLDRWNAHDIEGYLEVYWKSSELLVVIDSEQFNGWKRLHDSYIDGYPDRKGPALPEAGSTGHLGGYQEEGVGGGSKTEGESYGSRETRNRCGYMISSFPNWDGSLPMVSTMWARIEAG